MPMASPLPPWTPAETTEQASRSVGGLLNVDSTQVQTPPAELIDAEPAEAAALEGRVPHLLGGLRHHAARGTMINAAFQVGLFALTLLRRIAVAAFLTPSELGIWGVVLITVMTLIFLKNTGISDKFIQQ